MALQYWFPLTQDSRQQGLNSVAPTIMGTGITFVAGKLGKAAQFPNNCNSCINVPGLKLQTGSWAAWIKVLGSGATARQCLISEGRDSYNDGVEFYTSQAGTTLYFKAHTVVLSTTIALNTWYHVVGTFGNNSIKLYVDGVLKASNTYTDDMTYTYSNDRFVLGKMAFSYTSTGSYFAYNGCLNDVRVYDHVLSQMEVKELSKGLVLHYPLNRGGWGQENLVTGSNTNSLSTNNWAIGSQTGGNTRTIEQDETDTYCVKFVRDSTVQSGWYYLSYGNLLRNQIKTDTTYTLTFDCKASVNSSITFTGLLNGNATNYMTNVTTNIQSSVVANQWCHMKYQCKTISSFDGITIGSQVVYLAPQAALKAVGVTVYFKNIKLEEGSIATPWCPNSSDALATTMGLNGTTEYDCSGFCNNGTYSALPTVSSNTPKYNVSTYFGAYNTPHVDMLDSNLLSSLTKGSVAWWEYCTTTGNTLLFTGQSGSYYIGAGSATTRLYDSHIGESGITLYKDGVTQSTTQGTTVYHPNVFHTQNQWHHFVITGINLSEWTKFKINSYGGNWPLNAYVSDVRIYATALSASDVKSLYQNSAYIDSSGNVYGAVHSEV